MAGEIKIDKGIIAIVIAVLIYTVIALNLVSGFKALPSPIYGGDYYYQLGAVYHMYGSGIAEWFSSTNIPGGMPGYLPLYGIAVTIFGKIAGFDPMHAMFYSNIIWPVFALFSFYFLLNKILKESLIAALGSIALVGFSAFPILKYTEFTSLIVLPLFLIAFFNFFQSQDRKNALLLGVAYGAMGLAHGTSFFFSSFILFTFFTYYIFTKRSEGIPNVAKGLIEPFLFSFVFGFLISLLIWFGPIFISHGQATLKNTVFAFPDTARFDVGFGLLINGLSSMFFNFSSILALAISLLSLIGIFSLYRDKLEGAEYAFVRFMFFAAFIFTYSYFITSPILDIHMIPTYSQQMYVTPLAVIAGLVFFRDWTQGKENKRKWLVLFGFGLVALNAYLSYPSWYDGEWMNSGREDMFPHLQSAQAYLLANTSANDVILSNNELSFALNAVSGRKLVVSRRSQNDPFLDFDSRELDSAIIFYGNNTNKKLELLKRYDVKYLYNDAGWPMVEFEFQQDQSGKYYPSSYFDPLLMVYTPERENALKSNNVSYKRFTGYLDPSIRSPEIRMFDLIAITPDNYDQTGKGFWKNDIDPYLREVWSFSENGQKIAAMYELEAK